MGNNYNDVQAMISPINSAVDQCNIYCAAMNDSHECEGHINLCRRRKHHLKSLCNFPNNVKRQCETKLVFSESKKSLFRQLRAKHVLFENKGVCRCYNQWRIDFVMFY